MTSPQLQTFRNNLAANTLTDAERGALLTALDGFLGEFPQPDEISSANAFMPAIQVDWTSALFSIQGTGGAPLPPSDPLTDVTGTAPLVVTSPTPTTRNVALAAGFLPIARVATIAAMQALTIGASTAVDSTGALWTYEATGALPTDGITAVAATGLGAGQWWRGPTLIATQALAQTQWVLDPQNGAASDENTGLSSASPLRSYGEILRRWGTTLPKLTAAAVTVTWLSDGLTTDGVVAQTAQGTLLLNGTQTAAAPVALGTYTAKDKAAGTLATINVVGHGAWAPGTLVHDTTANAGFWIIADLGGGSATISQPKTLPIGPTSPSVDLVNGDALTVITQTAMSPIGLGTVEGSSFVFVNRLNLNQAAAVAQINKCVVSECATSGLSFQTSVSSAAFALPVFSDCYLGAPLAGKVSVYGGVLPASGTFNFYATGAAFDGDVAMMQRAHFTGTITIGSMYVAEGSWFEYGQGFNGGRIELHAVQISGTPATLYGPPTIQVAGGLEFTIDGATTATAALLCLGGVQIDNANTAFSFNETTGLFTGPTSITPAAIDAGGGMQNPATGSRVSFAG